MAVVNLKSTFITNRDAVPPVMNTPNLAAGISRPIKGFVTVAAADNIDSVYRLAPVKSSDLIHRLEIFNGAFGAAATMNFGFFQTLAKGGLIVGAGNQLATLIDMTVAHLVTPFDITHEVLALTDCEKRVWEVLGLAKDPMIEYDLCGQLKGAVAGNAVTLMLRGELVSGS